MADNRDDKSDQLRRGDDGARRSRPEDPLAELARLIDEDPFADFNTARQPHPQARSWPEPEADNEPPAWQEDASLSPEGEPEDLGFPPFEPPAREPEPAAEVDPPSTEHKSEVIQPAEESSQAVHADEPAEETPHAAHADEPDETQPPVSPAERPAFDPVAALEAHLFGAATSAEEKETQQRRLAPPVERDAASLRASQPISQTIMPSAHAPLPDYAPQAHAGPPAHDRLAEIPYGDSQRGRAYVPSEDDYGLVHEEDTGFAEDPGYADSEPLYGEDGHMPPMGHDGYERRPRRGLAIVGGLAGIVILGGAVALGYRGLGTEPAGEPPVIRADASPTKVIAEGDDTAEPDGQSKLVYDRIGGSPPDSEERLVSREEPVFEVEGRDQPVRRIDTLPETELRGNPDDTSDLATAFADEPRRVRTVIVRPDGTVVAPSEPLANPSEGPAQRVTGNTGPARDAEESASDAAATDAPPTASGEVATGPEEELVALAGADDPASQPAADFEPPSATTAAPEAQAQPSTPGPSAERRSGQPLQLVPQSQSTGQPQSQSQPQPEQTAMAPSAPSTTAQAFPSGSYVVQVASTRNEDEARGAASNIAERHSGVISGYQTSVERADLGDRGIFYRIGVGPVTSQADANALCERLKSNGLDCFVRRN